MNASFSTLNLSSATERMPPCSPTIPPKNPEAKPTTEAPIFQNRSRLETCCTPRIPAKIKRESKNSLQEIAGKEGMHKSPN
jgi:hypothetical protein